MGNPSVRQSFILIFLAFAVTAGMFIVGPAFCSSCPYCGQEYGEPMPGDEARVYELRRQHEASCPMRQSEPSYQPHPAAPEVVYGSVAIPLPDDSLRQQEEEAERRRLEEERRRHAFTQNRDELISSLKPSSDTQRTQGKGLRIKPVPSPSLHGSEGLGLKSTRPEGSGSADRWQPALPGAAEEGKGRVSEFWDRVKDFFERQIKRRMYDWLPGGGVIRSIRDELRKLYSGFRGIVINLYNRVMHSFKSTVEDVAGPSRTRRTPDETDSIGEETQERARELAGERARDEGGF